MQTIQELLRPSKAPKSNRTRQERETKRHEREQERRPGERDKERSGKGRGEKRHGNPEFAHTHSLYPVGTWLHKNKARVSLGRKDKQLAPQPHKALLRPECFDLWLVPTSCLCE